MRSKYKVGTTVTVWPYTWPIYSIKKIMPSDWLGYSYQLTNLSQLHKYVFHDDIVVK